jgi:hypothetical protein
VGAILLVKGAGERRLQALRPWRGWPSLRSPGQLSVGVAASQERSADAIEVESDDGV